MPAPYKFIPRTNHLLDLVGNGTIEASVVVDQVYAKFQHERIELKHRKGGKAHYLRDPLYAGMNRWLRGTARRMTRERMVVIFTDIADDLSGGVADQAPEWIGDLRNSGQPRVKDRGRFVYQGTHAPRLSKRVAEAKSKSWHEFYGVPFSRGRR